MISSQNVDYPPISVPVAPRQIPNKLLKISVFSLLTVCTILVLFIRYRLIFLVTPDIGGIESNVIYALQRYLSGYSLYANPETAPYSITQYSPFYYRIVAVIGSLVHIDPATPLSVYRLSRTVSLGSNILYAMALVMLGRQLKVSYALSVAVGVIAFILLPPQSYSRPDSVYNLLVIATLYAGVRINQAKLVPDERVWLAATVGLAALAIATKQSGVVLPLILSTYYAFFRKAWPEAVIIGVGTGLVALLFLVGLMPEHDPVLLYDNIVRGVNQGINWPSFKVNIVDHYFRTFGLQNAVGIPLCFWLMRQHKATYRWVGWFVLVLFSFSVLTSLKWGSALNYFTEYVGLTSLLVSVWLSEHSFPSYKQGVVFLQLTLSVLFWAVLPCMVNFNWPLVLHVNAPSEQPYYQQKQIADYLTDSLHLQRSDAVFITDFNYSYLNGFLYRNCLIPQQDMVASVMYPAQKFNYTALDAQIRKNKIRFLITRSHEETTAFPGLSTGQYVLRHSFPGYDVYEQAGDSRLTHY